MNSNHRAVICNASGLSAKKSQAYRLGTLHVNTQHTEHKNEPARAVFPEHRRGLILETRIRSLKAVAEHSLKTSKQYSVTTFRIHTHATLPLVTTGYAQPYHEQRRALAQQTNEPRHTTPTITNYKATVKSHCITLSGKPHIGSRSTPRKVRPKLSRLASPEDSLCTLMQSTASISTEFPPTNARAQNNPTHYTTRHLLKPYMHVA